MLDRLCSHCKGTAARSQWNGAETNSSRWLRCFALHPSVIVVHMSKEAEKKGETAPCFRMMFLDDLGIKTPLVLGLHLKTLLGLCMSVVRNTPKLKKSNNNFFLKIQFLERSRMMLVVDGN